MHNLVFLLVLTSRVNLFVKKKVELPESFTNYLSLIPLIVLLLALATERDIKNHRAGTRFFMFIHHSQKSPCIASLSSVIVHRCISTF